MILAAGLGTRLRPLTQKTPKALLLVGGQPLISYAIRLLARFGIRDIVINLHHLGELIEKEIGNGKKFGVKIRYSWEETILGTGGGVRQGAAFFGNHPFIVINSDVLIDLNLKNLLRFHRNKKGLATMVLRPLSREESFTPIAVGRNKRVLRIGEKPQGPAKPQPHPMMFTGVQMIEPDFLRFLPDAGPSCLVRQGYRPALEAGQKIFGYPFTGYWNDLGTLDRYRQAEVDLAENRVTLSYLRG